MGEWVKDERGIDLCVAPDGRVVAFGDRRAIEAMDAKLVQAEQKNLFADDEEPPTSRDKARGAAVLQGIGDAVAEALEQIEFGAVVWLR